MTTDLTELQRFMREQLESQKIRGIIGWEAGSNRLRARPAILRTAEEVDKAIFSPACSMSLVRLLIEDKRYPMDGEEDRRPIGIMLRGCDDKGVIELLKEYQTKRGDLVLLGVDCRGVVDWNKARKLMRGGVIGREDLDIGKLKWENARIVLVRATGEEIELKSSDIMLDKCLSCEGHTPRLFDFISGAEDKDRPESPDMKQIIELERRQPEERWEFWSEEFSKCIRCYACRNICTYCYCEECAIDPRTLAISDKSVAKDKANRPQWTGQDSTPPSNTFYLMSRAYHGAGRCTSCEECDRACPMGISLRLLNRKVRKDAKELFDYEAGKNHDDKPLFSDSCEKDPGDFIW